MKLHAKFRGHIEPIGAKLYIQSKCYNVYSIMYHQTWLHVGHENIKAV